MDIPYKRLALAGFIGCTPLLHSHPAEALTGPAAIQIDGGPFGPLQLSGGAAGYFYGQSGTSDKDVGGSLLGDRSTGVNLSAALITLAKTTGVMQFNIQVGAYGGTPFLGNSPPKANVNEFRTGPLYLGYFTIAPPGSPVTVSAGQLPSLEGWESTIDYNNANIFASSIWAVENNNSPGVSANYTQGPFNGTITFGDGWNTGVFNFLQLLGTYNFDSNNALSVYYAGNLGRTGLNALTFGQCGDARCTVADYGPHFMNSQMFGGYYSWTHGNLNLVGVTQFVYAKPDHQLGIDKYTSNFGATAIADYSFANTPYSIGGMANYFTSVGAANWYIAPRAAGFALQVTPTWQYKYLFARVSAAWVHLTNETAYGNNGTDRNTVQAALEAGVLF